MPHLSPQRYWLIHWQLLLFTVHSKQAIVSVNIYTTYQDWQSLLFSGECILGALTTCAYLPE